MFNKAIELITQYVDYSSNVYICPKGNLRTGYNTLINSNTVYGNILGSDIIEFLSKNYTTDSKSFNKLLISKYGNLVNKEEAKEYLEMYLKSIYRNIKLILPDNLTDNQYSALLSLTYDIGVQDFKVSKVTKLIKVGDIQGASKDIISIPGSSRKRKAEKKLFLSASK